MAKEKQKPYEFLSNLVLALMDTDSAFINAFFMDEFAISSKTLGGIRRGEDMCIYQYVRVIRCMTKYLHLMIQLDMLLKELRIVLSSNCDLVVGYSSSLFSRNLSAERMGDSNGMGWGEIVISTENGALFRFFCLNAFSI